MGVVNVNVGVASKISRMFIEKELPFVESWIRPWGCLPEEVWHALIDQTAAWQAYKRS